MATITTRSGKGSPLTNDEVDNNFTNLNDDKVEKSGDTLTGDLAFGDNVKAKFGDSDDLEIYHDGSGSYITDQGTGSLRISGTNLNLQSAAGEIYLRGINNGAVDIRYDNAIKLETTSTGIDVTGTVVADGLKIDSGVFDINLEGSLDALPADNDESHIFTTSGSGSGFFAKYGALGLSSRNKDTSSSDIGFFTDKLLRVEIADTGDISFYEDTGTTAKLTWDASDESLKFSDNVRLKLGSSDDFQGFHNGSNSYWENYTGDVYIDNRADDKDVNIRTDNGSGGYTFYFKADGSTGEAILYHYGSEKLATKSTGIDVTGTVTADGLTVDGSGTLIEVGDGGVSADAIINLNDGRSFLGYNGSNGMTVLQSGSSKSLDFRVNGNVFASGTRTMKIDPNGDIAFYDDAGTSQDLYWDASTSRLGLGTTSPSTTLHLYNTGGTELRIQSSANSDTGLSLQGDRSWLIQNDGNASLGGADYLHIYDSTAGASRLTIDTSGNVGIGTTSPDKALVVSGVGAEIVINDTDTTDTPLLRFRESGSTSATIFTDGGNLIFTYGSTQAARIDSSGNLLVGTTDNSPENNSSGTSADDGIALMNAGYISACNYGAASLFLNRTSTDGEIAQFRKDGATVGSIGVSQGSALYIVDSSSGGIRFGASNEIIPCQNNGLRVDNTVNLGQASYRWKDLYLSGGVYLGGTGANNLLDDYEEGTTTVTYRNLTDTPTTDAANYVKTGDLVCISGYLNLSGSETWGGALFDIRDLPFIRYDRTTFNDAACIGTAVVNGSLCLLRWQGILGGGFELFYISDGSKVDTADIASGSIISWSVTYRTT